jgi:hypothetical protein
MRKKAFLFIYQLSRVARQLHLLSLVTKYLDGLGIIMGLLQLENSGDFSLTEDYTEHVPPYAILSHTWGKDIEKVRRL